jgi:hypothetical protein
VGWIEKKMSEIFSSNRTASLFYRLSYIHSKRHVDISRSLSSPSLSSPPSAPYKTAFPIILSSEGYKREKSRRGRGITRNKGVLYSKKKGKPQHNTQPKTVQYQPAWVNGKKEGSVHRMRNPEKKAKDNSNIKPPDPVLPETPPNAARCCCCCRWVDKSSR